MVSPTPADKRHGSRPLDMDYIDRSMTFTPSECCTISCGTVCVDPRTSRVLIIYNRRLEIWQLPKGRKNIGEDLQSAALRETYEETGVHADLLPLKVRTRSTRPFVENDIGSHPIENADGGVLHRTTLSAASMSSASTVYSTSVDSTASSVFISPLAQPLFGSNAPATEIDASEMPGGHIHSLRVEQRDTVDVSGELHPYGMARAVDCPQGRLDSVEDHTSSPIIVDTKLTSDKFNNESVGIVQYPDLQAATPNTIKTVFFFAARADSTAPLGLGAQEDHEDLYAEWVEFHVASQRLRFGPEKEVVWKVKRDLGRSGIRC